MVKISIIGTGYVGLPTGVNFANLGNEVICMDKDAAKIEKLNAGKTVLYENELPELFNKVLKSGKLKFTTQMLVAADAELIFITVGTPINPETKEADLQYIRAVASELAPLLTGYKIIVIKSTVPVGTGAEVANLIHTINPQAEFDVVSIPEFLREGFAIYDLQNPDRIVIGSDSERPLAKLKELYEPWKGRSHLLFTKRESAELIKYASNAFLAMKISYINEISDLCEQCGADIEDIAKGIGLDSRIGHKFLRTGPGYGGSCFPKDTNALYMIANKFGVEMSLVATTIKRNEARKVAMARRINNYIVNINSPVVAVWGLAFKADTDDVRDSPAIEIVNNLLGINYAVTIKAFDPQAMENARTLLGNKVSYCPDLYAAVEGADILAVLTDWHEFAEADFAKVASHMRNKLIVDVRNLLNEEKLKQLGFVYNRLGKRQND